MIESRVEEGQEVDSENIQVRVLSKDQVNPQEQDRLLDLFKVGYGERWISDENFRKIMLPNATQVLQILLNGNLAAALLFDHERISDISVHPDYQGKGLGVRLFEEAAMAQAESWISVGVSADAMLATITNDKLNFLPVEDKQKIEKLFQGTNRGKNNFRVETRQIKVPLLTERLAKRGIAKDEFIGFIREGATHGSKYYQILFQNQT